jgi:hypothetical protein
VGALLAVGGCGTQVQAGAALPHSTVSTQPSPQRTTSVPTVSSPGEVPTVPPSVRCPASGLRAGVGGTSAASGLRVLTVSVTDCGTKSRTVSGYPQVRVLGYDTRPLTVDVHHGASVTTAIDDPGPTTVTLGPGQSATAVLAWRNTVTESTVAAQTGGLLEFTVGGARQNLPATIDLGNTGKLDVTAWRRPAA